jgi:hypothetical protein
MGTLANFARLSWPGSDPSSQTSERLANSLDGRGKPAHDDEPLPFLAVAIASSRFMRLAKQIFAKFANGGRHPGKAKPCPGSAQNEAFAFHRYRAARRFGAALTPDDSATYTLIGSVVESRPMGR